MRRISIFAAILAATIVGAASGATQSTKLALVAYSTPKDAYGKIIPSFQSTSAGKDVSFSQSYGASGDQAHNVLNGQSADIVAFSLQPDVSLLVHRGLVPGNWNRDKFKGMVTDSVVVFVVRDGNPKKIHSWNDLTKKGIEVITPNPFTSGGARWNVIAGYGAQRKLGKSHKQAVAWLTKLFHHVPVQPDSARTALTVFAQGKGDVLLTYENEAIYANKKGVRTDYVIPKQTILIENPVALTKTGVKHKEAKAFLTFLHSAKAQRIFGDTGYRPVLPSVARGYHFPQPAALFNIHQLGLGGWVKVEKRWFDVNNGIMAKIERSIGH
jgi:sulfate/thiosulfate transport system substrate-binding protein